MEPSSPFLKILPYEVARGWVEGLVGGASKPSPDIVRDGTAWGKGETEEYYYYLSIRFSSVFIFLP